MLPEMLPEIGVVIATVHRPEDIVQAVGSVLLSSRDRFQVWIVDQSQADDSRRHLLVYAGQKRVHYLSKPPRGLSAALNLGTEAAADADLIAITGDDCLVPRDWLERITEAFARDPSIGVVFGQVTSAPFDAALGFVPGCRIRDDFLARQVGDLHRMTGTTACMVVRTQVWRELGGFDEALGVGAPLRSGEDLDFALRALQAGYTVLQTPAVMAEHQTPVLWAERAGVVRRNWYGTGAVMAKFLKLAGVPMAMGLIRLARRWLSGGSGVAVTYGPRPQRVAMLQGFVLGFLRGLIMPVDRPSGRFARSAWDGT
jgi:GT2 family glycosyltransferase